MPSSESRTGVVERAFAMLDAFDDQHPALPLSALAKRSRLPPNTALRIARTLVVLGALELDAEGRYVVGIRLFEIAALAPRGHGLRRLAMPYMEDLSRVTGHHVLLTIREASDAILVERLSARDAEPVAFRIGGRLPLNSTGGGLVLLANAPAPIQDEAIRSFQPVPGLDILRSGDDLRSLLADIRLTGYVTAERTKPWPGMSVAAPIRDRSGATIAAVSIVFTSNATDARSYIPAVATVARSISRQVDM